MWGGRFAEGPSAIMREINASIPFDKALWRQDIAASKAHVAMLGAQGIVSSADAAAISAGLDQVAAEYAANGVPENWDLEDIHMTTESRLAELIGPAAGRLHTARSRNDQVATDFRLWVRDAIDAVEAHAIEAMILATAQHLTAVAPDAPPYADFSRDLALFLDLDLSSLGASWDVFWDNFGRIRAEYPFIPERDFLRGRQAGLRSFAAGGAALFRLDETRALWMTAALENCRRADETISRLLADG